MINIKKGLDLPISGKPDNTVNSGNAVKHVAILGSDFPGLKPSMLVSEGDSVSKGQVLFTDKKNPGVKYTAPIAGKVVAINRGAKRAFQSLVIEIDPTNVGNTKFEAYPSIDLSTLSREVVQKQLVDSGVWTSLRTRPYSKTPAINTVPDHIFVTAMDTNPLAGNPTLVISTHTKDFCDGLDVLSTLTDGFVYVCKGQESLPTSKSSKVKEEVFIGKHPAGLPGTHMHFIHPASENHVMWYLNYQDVIAIGHLFRTGDIYNERVVSIAGPHVRNPRLVRTLQGACVSELVQNELKGDNYRVISGSVLNGNKAEGAFDYMGKFHLQVSVIPEGNNQEFLGWLMPGAKKHSVTRTYLSSFFPPRRFNITTAVNGGSRAMVPIGNFEKVMPLDIIPTMLLRAIEIGDTDTAKLLGCMELDEEDLALCTYVCPGKTEYGRLLRKCLTKIEVEG
ncbi:MAG: Na(+)-translocating NADH-quinone reductase subunit A [Succinivibrionaceae bacterium]